MGMYCTNKIAITTTKSEFKEIVHALSKGFADWPAVLDIYSDFERKEISYTSKGYPSSEEDKQKAAMSKSYPSVLFHYTTDMEGECDSSSTWFCNGREGTRKGAKSFRKAANQEEVRKFTSASLTACEGIAHRVEIMSDGKVAACGENRFGECEIFQWKNIKQISCGNWHTVGLRTNGSVVACGSNVNGQCNVKDIPGKAVAVSCGRYHTAILMESGRVIVKGSLEQKATAHDKGWEKPLLADDFPKTEKLILTDDIPGWEEMNDLIEDISAGDELLLERSSIDDEERFTVLNMDGEKIGEMDFPFPSQLTILLDYIKVTAETVTPLSKQCKGSKYAQMTIKLEYMGRDKQIDFPKIKKLMLSNHTPGWEKMNDLIEDIAPGDELLLRRSLIANNWFEVLNMDGEKIGSIDFHFSPKFSILLDYIKVTAETVTPLSKRSKGSKYAQMTIKLDIELDTQTEKNDSEKLGEYEQTRVVNWPKVERIKSVFDAVIGITSEGKIFIDGFCPLHKADIEKIMGK